MNVTGRAPAITSARLASKLPNTSKKLSTLAGLIMPEMASPNPKIIPDRRVMMIGMLPHKICRVMNTTTNATAMKTHVATSDRGDRRAIPQMPWPLVQPPPTDVPAPTSRPAAAASRPVAGKRTVPGSNKPANAAMTAPPKSPAVNATRHPLPSPGLRRSAATMPLTPAIRPLAAIIKTAASPMSNPPMSDARGVNSVSILPPSVSPGPPDHWWQQPAVDQGQACTNDKQPRHVPCGYRFPEKDRAEQHRTRDNQQ